MPTIDLYIAQWNMIQLDSWQHEAVELVPPPDDRSYRPEAEDRSYRPEAEDRSYRPEAEDRTYRPQP